jgi:hypothetical protein
MNRALVIPAVGCVMVFAGTFAMLHRAAGETGRKGETPPAPARENAAITEPEAKLKAIAADYVKPWQDYQKSPARLYSRIAPRPVPSIEAEVELVTTDVAPMGAPLLATIHVKIGDQKSSTPCLIDRDTKEIRLFAQGKWQKVEDWMKSAPNPRTYVAPTNVRMPGVETPTALPAPTQGER